MIATVNPAIGLIVREYKPQPVEEIEAALVAASRACQRQRRSSFAERAQQMTRVAEILERDQERLAHLITLEMGKLRKEAVGEVEKSAKCCRFYAERAEQFLRERVVISEARRSAVRYQPLGLILAIMPWNFPFWQVVRFAAPALMAGNVALLKHASNVPQCALALAELFREAGFGDGVFTTLLIETAAVPAIVADARVRAVTLTGSDRAGSAVAEMAGRALKKCVLELGGSDAFIVMPSADFEAAVATAVKARTINVGQSCIAGKRFLIHEAIYEKFVAEFVKRMRSLTPGDPALDATTLAPMATASIREGVAKQVTATLEAGAKLLCGGRPRPGGGNFYEATVLAEIPRTSPAYREEIFGPVAAVFRVSDAAEAVRLANDSAFGLGASVWTNDAAEQEFFANEVESGMVFVNALVASDPHLPFGGVKRSGYGRELGAEGIREFANTKTVYVG